MRHRTLMLALALVGVGALAAVLALTPSEPPTSRGDPPSEASEGLRPGTYWPKSACVRVPFPEAPFPAGWVWCADSVVVTDDLQVQVHVSWTGFGLMGMAVEKGSDAGNRNMYLTDDLGRRYGHQDTTDAAKFGGRLSDDNPRLAGAFLFPALEAGAKSLSFHDDDQGVAIEGIVLADARRTDRAASHAVLGRILDADQIAIKASWRGLGEPQDDSWVLERTSDGFDGGRRIPRETAELFLATLTDAPLLREAYVPYMDHTDDYPHLEITVRAGTDTIRFFSESQGPRHVPWACQIGDVGYVVPSDHPHRALEIVRPLLEGGAGATPVPRAQDDLRTAGGELRIAAQTAQSQRVRELIAAGADVNEVSDYDGETPLTAAALWGHAETVRLLLEAGADPRYRTQRGTALEIATTLGHGEVVRVLTEAGAERGPATRWLSAAVRSGSLAAVRALLAVGADPNDPGSGPLVAAATGGWMDIARTLLEAGALVDGQVRGAPTPLMMAAQHGHTEMVRLLLAAGAGVNHQDPYGQTALSLAAGNGYPDIVELLLEAGAEVDLAARDGGTPLLRAGVPAIVASLLDAGADPNVRHENGMTPLHLTVSGTGGRNYYAEGRYREGLPNDRTGTARLLLEAGADVDARDAGNCTALILAVSGLARSHDALIRTLLQAGADPNVKDKKKTPLHYAAANYIRFRRGPRADTFLQIVRDLIEAGATDEPDDNGVTVLEAATRARADALVELLKTSRQQP